MSKVKAAFVFVAPQADAQLHQAQINTPVVELKVVGVKNYDEAEIVVQSLLNEGITAIELCAGFGNEGTARIARIAGDRAVVGAVRFDLHPGFNHKSGDKLF